jgi:hypothetical protein
MLARLDPASSPSRAPQGTSWTRDERRAVRLIAVLPFAASLALALVMLLAAQVSPLRALGSNPAVPIAFGVLVLCAYVSLLLGVAPLLVWFERMGWRSWFHFALAGCAGVVLPWLLLAAATAKFRHGGFDLAAGAVPWGTLLAALSLPGGFGAGAALLFWRLCVRRPRANDPA